MKIPMAIAELVAEFSGINRTPAFKPVITCPEASGRTTPTPSEKQQQKYHGGRRQSTVITVGADSIPTIPSESSSIRKSSRTGSCGGPEVKFRKNRRQSAPCISTIASSTCLKEKMNRLRSANSSGDEQEDDIKEEENDEDFHIKSRKQSISYRIA